jgi:hypothetical protein
LRISSAKAKEREEDLESKATHVGSEIERLVRRGFKPRFLAKLIIELHVLRDVAEIK